MNPPGPSTNPSLVSQIASQPSHSPTSQPIGQLIGTSVQNVARRRAPVGPASPPESYIDEENGYVYAQYNNQYNNQYNSPYNSPYNGYTYEDEALVRSREYKVARRTRRPSFGRGVNSANNGWMTTCLFCLVVVMIGIIVVGTLYMTQLPAATKHADSPPSPPIVPNVPTEPTSLSTTPNLDALWQHVARQNEALQRLNETLNAHLSARARLRATNRTHAA